MNNLEMTNTELVEVRNQQVVVSSRKIAEVFKKRHSEVIRAVERHMKDLVATDAKVRWFYETTYQDAKGEARKEYIMNRDGFSLLVMSFNNTRDVLQWKLKYIEAFNQMEKELNAKPKNKMQVMADELTATLNVSKAMQEFFKMDESTAKIFALRTGLNGSYKAIDSKTVDTFIKQLPASETNSVALLTATDLANELSSQLNKKISNRTVNQVLCDLGYQTRINKKWTLTDKANDYANQIPFQNDDNGHLGFQIKWKNTILDVLLDYFKN